MKSDAIIMAWHGKRPEAADWVRQEVSRRLLAAGSVLDGLRERTKDRLVRWAEKFRSPGSWEAATPEISRLLFIAEYESTMGVRRVQELRSGPREARVRDGVSIPLKKSEGNFWRVLAPLDLALFEQSRAFSHLLVPDGEAGDEAERAFDDLRYRSSPNPGNSGVCFARVRDTIVDRTAGEVRGLVLEVTYPRDHAPFAEGDLAMLHPRFTDFTVSRYVTVSSLSTGSRRTLSSASSATRGGSPRRSPSPERSPPTPGDSPAMPGSRKARTGHFLT